MRQSLLFTKSIKEAAHDEVSTNAKLLMQAGFIDKTMAGVFTFLPLGLRVLSKIETIVRKEMDKVGSEVFMPSLSPKALWEKTGRIDSVDVLMNAIPANAESKKVHKADYILNATHEEIITPVVQKYAQSYKDFPIAAYQINTKFRNEPRPKSGLLRGREFRMKDLYSFHTSKEDLLEFYETMKEVYMDIYKNLGIGEETYIVTASGGDFTEENSHEFQIKCDTGEDTIYYDNKTETSYNEEIVDDKKSEQYETFKASEIGNIFPLMTRYSEALNFKFADKDGTQKPVFMGSYGIGTSRVMGIMAEIFNDENGLIWPKEVAPFQVHLVSLQPTDELVNAEANKLYKSLQKQNVEVLYDDRENASPGEKFAESDLIGIPTRIVISKRSIEKNAAEVKERTKKEPEHVPLNSAQKVY